MQRGIHQAALDKMRMVYDIEIGVVSFTAMEQVPEQRRRADPLYAATKALASFLGSLHGDRAYVNGMFKPAFGSAIQLVSNVFDEQNEFDLQNARASTYIIVKAFNGMEGGREDGALWTAGAEYRGEFNSWDDVLEPATATLLSNSEHSQRQLIKESARTEDRWREIEEGVCDL